MPDTQPTDREVIELLAGRVMGWEYSTLDFPDPEPPVWFREATFVDGIRVSSRHKNTLKSIVWNPLESIADAFEMQSAIPEDKQQTYLLRLYDSIIEGRAIIGTTRLYRGLVFATARQRSMAAWEVFKDA